MKSFVLKIETFFSEEQEDTVKLSYVCFHLGYTFKHFYGAQRTKKKIHGEACSKKPQKVPALVL